MQDMVCHIKEMETYQRNNPASWNYHYDSIGNLTRDLNEGILAIYWTVTGKVSEVIFVEDLQNNSYDLAFRYDPLAQKTPL